MPKIFKKANQAESAYSTLLKGDIMSIVEILMKRDGMTEKQAKNLVDRAQKDMHKRLSKGEMPMDICEEWFGLEPDYIMDMI